VGRRTPYPLDLTAGAVRLRAHGQHLRRYRDTQAPVLIAFCKERLAAYKCPRIVEVMDDLPKTVTGKILRRELRKVKER
jgi:acyl-coenzyme A synthetase/AMP-(fatty) acid ligase